MSMAVIDFWTSFTNLLRPIVRNFDVHQGFWLVSLTIGLLVIAWRTCIVTSRNDAKRSRPYVILEAVSGIFLGVRLNNVGLTMAKNVRITATPPIKMALLGDRRDIKFISKGVDCLPPRMCLETMLGTWTELKKDNPGVVFKGKIAYEDDRGRKYSEEFVLDYSLFEDIALSLKENSTASSIQELTKELHNYSTGFHNFHVAVARQRPLRFRPPPDMTTQTQTAVVPTDQQMASSTPEQDTKRPING